MPLSDEQLGPLFTIYAYGTITEALNAAYRMGMMRAAEVCEKEARKWEGDGTPSPMPRICADAIRAEAGETTLAP